jgi:hypothetical protein
MIRYARVRTACQTIPTGFDQLVLCRASTANVGAVVQELMHEPIYTEAIPPTCQDKDLQELLNSVPAQTF